MIILTKYLIFADFLSYDVTIKDTLAYCAGW